jgi:hypothetical protein
MPTTPNMNLEVPTEDGSANVWDTILNLVFGITGDGIDGHDHTTGKGVPIPSAALRINADVACAYDGDSYALTALKAVDFTPHAPADVAGYAAALFVSSADNNLYFRTTGGVNVKIIDGVTLNVSIVGGIGGDYASVEALLDYDDATDTYRARQELDTGVRQYGKMAHADLLLYEYDAAGDATVPANAVTIKSPDALAAPYAITFPAAVPAAATVVMMSTAGVLSVPQADVSLPSGCHVVLSGTGRYKHGDLTFPQTPQVAFGSGAVTYSTSMTGVGDYGVGIATGTALFRIEGLIIGQRIKTVTIFGVGPVVGTGLADYDVMRQGSSPVAASSLLSAVTSSDAASVTLTLAGGGYAVGSGDAIYLKVTIPGATEYGYYGLRSVRDWP